MIFLTIIKTLSIIYLDLSDDRIENKVQYCRQLLKLADVIEPGLTQFRGQLLYELQAAMEHQIKRKFNKDSTQFQVFVLGIILVNGFLNYRIFLRSWWRKQPATLLPVKKFYVTTPIGWTSWKRDDCFSRVFYQQKDVFKTKATLGLNLNFLRDLGILEATFPFRIWTFCMLLNNNLNSKKHIICLSNNEKV